MSDFKSSHEVLAYIVGAWDYGIRPEVADGGALAIRCQPQPGSTVVVELTDLSMDQLRAILSDEREDADRVSH